MWFSIKSYRLSLSKGTARATVRCPRPAIAHNYWISARLFAPFLLLLNSAARLPHAFQTTAQYVRRSRCKRSQKQIKKQIKKNNHETQ